MLLKFVLSFLISFEWCDFRAQHAVLDLVQLYSGIVRWSLLPEIGGAVSEATAHRRVGIISINLYLAR